VTNPSSIHCSVMEEPLIVSIDLDDIAFE